MTRTIPFDSIKPVEWIEGGEPPNPMLVADYNEYFNSSDGYKVETHGLIGMHYNSYVINTMFIVAGPGYLVPGYGEAANSWIHKSGEIDPKTGWGIQMVVYDFDIWILGNTSIIKSALDHQPHFNLPEFALSADSQESDEWLKRVFTFKLATDKMWGGGGCIRQLRLRKPKPDYDVLVHIENPAAAIYETPPWRAVEKAGYKHAGEVGPQEDWISTENKNRDRYIYHDLKRRP